MKEKEAEKHRVEQFKGEGGVGRGPKSGLERKRKKKYGGFPLAGGGVGSDKE